jgi:hypothetical protein
MQISLKWVNELVNIETVNLNYLIKNRSDSLSIQDIFKERTTLLNKLVEFPKYSVENLNWKKTIDNLSS